MAASNPLCVILTGMHRSGTSLMGRFMLASGLYMGDELVGPKPANPHGYFEDVEILAFQQEILAAQNAGENMLVERPPVLGDQDRARARDIIERRRARGVPWGWKEPRTCLFLDFWAQLLPEAKFAFVYRRPALVLDSLGRRQGVAPKNRDGNSRHLGAWCLYNSEIIRFYQQHRERSVLFSLHRATEQPDRFTELLSARLGHAFSSSVFREAFDEEILHQAPPASRRVNWLVQWRSRRLMRELDALSEV